MKQIYLSEIITEELANGAIINNQFKGFPEDYLVIHCLLKKWKPKSLFEIGTCTGFGTKIMKNAIGECKIYTLDIRTNTGVNIDFEAVKIIADSTSFDYSQYYPIDAWFIDAEHIYDNVYIESREAIKSDANYIVYHDADIVGVYNAIVDSFEKYDIEKKYELYRVIDTRILYAIKKQLE